MRFHLRLLGSPDLLSGEGHPVPLPLGKPFGLLVYVALAPRPISREEVAQVFWPDAPRDNALHSLRQAIWILKNTLGEDLIQGDGLLSVKQDALKTDLDGFSEALAGNRVEEAKELWRGRLLDGFALPGLRSWDNWVEDLRSEWERRFQAALVSYADELRQDGALETALDQLEMAGGLAPQSEAVLKGRIDLFLETRQLSRAREAITLARGSSGKESEGFDWLVEMEARLDRILESRRAQADEGPGFRLEFVGRSRELALLRRAYEEALSGTGKVAVVTGPAGIGKTRLAGEFLVGTPGEDAAWVEVKGSRAGMKLRWGGGADLVRKLLLLPGSPGISPASDSLLRAMIPSLGRNEVNLETVNGVSPVALLDALMDLLEAVSFETPLVVHLDDFQWFDSESRTLVLNLVSRSLPHPVLFLISGRPDLASSHWKTLQRTLEREARASSILLQPLGLVEVWELLGMVADFSHPDEAEGVVRRIYAASGGNPLFIQGLLQDFHDQGILTPREGGWVLDTARLPAEFGFPEDIRDLLKERLHRLSDSATRVAGVLAGEGRAMTPRALARVLGQQEAAVTEAIAELLDREVLGWVAGESLDFCHDLIREAALAHSPATGGPGRRWRELRRRHPAVAALVAGLILVALPLGILWGSGAPNEEESPAFGGGTLYFRKAEGAHLTLEVGRGSPDSWVIDSVVPPPGGTATLPFRQGDGTLTWFGWEGYPSGPKVIRFGVNDTSELLFPGRGDQIPQDLSPDGTRLLFRDEDTEGERFTLDLYWGDLRTRERQLVHKGHGPIGNARWSPDGDLIAVLVQGKVDTLAIYSVQGQRVGFAIMEELRGLTWCGGSVLVSGMLEGENRLVRFTPPSMDREVVDDLGVITGLACSPRGDALVHRGISGGRPLLLLRDLNTGEVQELPPAFLNTEDPRWLPFPGASVPVDIRAEADSIRIAWGETRILAADLVLSGGGVSREGIWWEALDPGVASYTPGQGLTGNHGGEARVVARWGYSLADTVIVRVEEEGSGGAWYRDPLRALDTSRWLPFGDPIPVPDTLDGEPVLRLRGDEKYGEGILLRDPLRLDQGITVEAEFRMALTRPVAQNFSLCLMDMNLATQDLELASFYRLAQGACFKYPAREFEKQNPAEGVLTLGWGVETRVRAQGTLPPADWTHVGLQVRADGQVSIVLNRQVVAESPLRLRIRPDHRWTLVLQGDAVGTDLFVRDLSIWKEPRFFDGHASDLPPGGG